MTKILNKVFAIFKFIKRVTPMVVDSADSATKKYDKVIGQTEAKLQKVIEAKGRVKTRIDQVHLALEEQWDKAEADAEEAAKRLEAVKKAKLW